ncbi:hypothetical protein [uncultured Rikenella sp.]|uniref:hypothetical protein n=1 Tax=uncultured Rikenella sp. TaxID=368003 RepID=UPI002616EA3C|nr:hypothetical protein [uncultured Rikenella sp.]
MKQTLTYHSPIIVSTARRTDPGAYDRSLEHFKKGEYMPALHALLDYIHPELRRKYGNPEGTEFHVPHGSIIVGLKIAGDRLEIDAPFLALPDKGRIPLLRQIAGLNNNVLDLPCIRLCDGQFHFTYDCPLALAHPEKIYDVLDDICRTGDRYDDEFAAKFGASRINEPIVKPYDSANRERICNGIRQTCAECLEAVKGFENERKYGYAWDVIASALLGIVYFARPQGRLLNELDKAIQEHDREDIPIQEVIARGKEALQKIASLDREQLAEWLYFVETFVPGKRRSNLKNIQDNFRKIFDEATSAANAGDLMACCLMIVYKFYEMYYYNDVQDDVNAVVSKALHRASAMPWDTAAPILHAAMAQIMAGRLDDDNDNGDPEETTDRNAEISLEAALAEIQKIQQEAVAQAKAVQARTGLQSEAPANDGAGDNRSEENE